MPEGAVYVGRPSKWGNHYEVVNGFRQGWLVYDRRVQDGYLSAFKRKEDAQAHAVGLWIEDFQRDPLRLALAGQIAYELTGRDLACWCPVGTPCHADVLLELANP